MYMRRRDYFKDLGKNLYDLVRDFFDIPFNREDCKQWWFDLTGNLHSIWYDITTYCEYEYKGYSYTSAFDLRSDLAHQIINRLKLFKVRSKRCYGTDEEQETIDEIIKGFQLIIDEDNDDKSLYYCLCTSRKDLRRLKYPKTKKTYDELGETETLEQSIIDSEQVIKSFNLFRDYFLRLWV